MGVGEGELLNILYLVGSIRHEGRDGSEAHNHIFCGIAKSYAYKETDS